MMMACKTLNQLPVELISHILGFLDQSTWIERRAHDDPAHILDDDPKRGDTTAEHDDLKTASLVCRLWRACVLPVLFRSVVWRFQSIRRPGAGGDALAEVEELEWLRFLRGRGLVYRVRSLTVVIDYPLDKVGEDLCHHEHAGILPSHLPSGEAPAWDNNWLWRTIFEHLDPSTITLISSPAILASLLGRPIDLSGAWLLSQRFHILSLSRESRAQVPPSPIIQSTSSRASSSSGRRSVPCDLFSIRDWTSLLINEGSSVKAYSTYEYFNFTPPSLLPALLDSSDASVSRLLTTLESLSYVAIFPLSTHIANTLVPRIPSLNRFFIQIVPRQLSFADEAYRHPAIDINDFWVERNLSYDRLAMAVFDMQPSGGWKDLQVFESGDSQDGDAWEQAVRFVVYNAGTKWQVNGKGVFARRHDEIAARLSA